MLNALTAKITMTDHVSHVTILAKLAMMLKNASHALQTPTESIMKTVTVYLDSSMMDTAKYVNHAIQNAKNATLMDAQFVHHQELTHHIAHAQMVSSTKTVIALTALRNARNASMVYVLNAKSEE
jgi:hypothetical protein